MGICINEFTVRSTTTVVAVPSRNERYREALSWTGVNNDMRTPEIELPADKGVTVGRDRHPFNGALYWCGIN